MGAHTATLVSPLAITSQLGSARIYLAVLAERTHPANLLRGRQQSKDFISLYLLLMRVLRMQT